MFPALLRVSKYTWPMFYFFLISILYYTSIFVKATYQQTMVFVTVMVRLLRFGSIAVVTSPQSMGLFLFCLEIFRLFGIRNIITSHIWCFHGSVAENSHVVGCYAESTSKHLPTYRRNVVSLFSKSNFRVKQFLDC